jgi:hypothetical protein
LAPGAGLFSSRAGRNGPERLLSGDGGPPAVGFGTPLPLARRARLSDGRLGMINFWPELSSQVAGSVTSLSARATERRHILVERRIPP